MHEPLPSMSKDELQAILDRMVDTYYRVDLKGKLLYLSPSITDLIGYEPSEILHRQVTEFYWDKNDRKTFLRLIARTGKISGFETRLRHKNGHPVWVSVSSHYFLASDDTPLGIEGFIRNISDKKHNETALRRETEARAKALSKVEQKNREIEEANIALQVLLKQQQQSQAEIREQISAHLQDLVFPYLGLLARTELDNRQKDYLDIIHSNLEQISDQLVSNLRNPLLRLTSREILVADLVRQGKTSKEIAWLLGLSPRTVESYRNSLRKKLGLKQKKLGLRAYLRKNFSPA